MTIKALFNDNILSQNRRSFYIIRCDLLDNTLMRVGHAIFDSLWHEFDNPISDIQRMIKFAFLRKELKNDHSRGL